MDSKTTHSPLFLVFPPEVTVPKYQQTALRTTATQSKIPLPTCLAKRQKILGTTQIVFGLMHFSFGVILFFTLVPPYPRFPFIFISGYPFWSSVLFINSGAFLIGMKRKTTRTLMLMSRIMNTLSALGAIAGIILLSFGFALDRHYLCGYSDGASECHAITTLLMGILIMLMAFTIIELFISSSFSVLATHSILCQCEE
ncbi:membrane-spanning 4-domains subfamily A member 5 [Choloepus didactylus]|uniref:membrane-spanning 4-domains subfamily A member 5 n=1 Tax=Choloepus didactylus TaxID=27675 RepID=UPI0018A1012C|nr:membrane-spanning 4-domains subfamily A member 5 [Choloepus didactylus]